MRDLRSEIQNKVAKKLTKLGTLNNSCVFQRTGGMVYVNGAATYPILSSTNIKVAFVEFNATRTQSTDIQHDEEPVSSIDKVAIFSQLLLPFKVSKMDVIIDSSLVEWKVLGITGDTADAHYSLHVRPVKNG